MKFGDRPKFIGSSSVFAPNPIDATESKKAKNRHHSDSWPAFPHTRRTLLRCIVENQIQNVVFLCGDIHCSNVAEIKFSGTEQAKQLKAFSITSSAFYWPFSFADGEPSGYVHDSKRQGDTFRVTDQVSMDYKAYSFTQENNFCKVTVEADQNTLLVQAIDESGQAIQESQLRLG